MAGIYYSTRYSSPVGELTLVADTQSLVSLWLPSQKYYNTSISERSAEKPDLPLFAIIKTWLDHYFGGQPDPISILPLAPSGSPFRLLVWRKLTEIPYGEVTSYGAIARQLAMEMGKSKIAAQAVGGAIGHNPISIIIPCHRVIGSDGSLTGFGGGIQTKWSLLELEGLDMSKFYIPKKGTAL